jgi:hypothetical protein
MSGNEVILAFGDTVRIKATPDTERAGAAGRRGSISGFTTPSVSAIVPIGHAGEDYAIAVMFDDGAQEAMWFVESLVQLLDHNPGLEIAVGNPPTLKIVRTADGDWVETSEGRKRPWWKFW